MNDHERYEVNLPFLAAGQLNGEERVEMEKHLANCAKCQADLGLWKSIADDINAADSTIPAPIGLDQRAITKTEVEKTHPSAFLRAWQLLRSQVLLVKRDLWPASAVVMALGIAVIFLVGEIEVIRFVAPLVAAASLAVIFGPEHDPACELVLATPISPWKVLLTRLTLVYGYNLLLAVAASSFILVFATSTPLKAIVLGWLGPMTFLSALALFLSMWMGTGNSIAVAYGLWIIQYPRFELVLTPSAATTVLPILDGYREFWNSPLLMLGLGLIIFTAALLSAKRSTSQLQNA
jgi:hypothetical protein